MPSISMFYGMIVYMYNFDNIKHHEPHIHIKYQGEFTVIGIPNAEILEGNLPANKYNIIKAWITIHEEELMSNWDIAINGDTVYRIEPLK